MSREFIRYEEALALKELGFDNVPCMGVYYNVTNIEDIDIDCEEHFSPCNYETQYYANKGYKNAVLAPLYQQAFRWFREEHKLEGDVSHLNDGRLKWSYVIRNIVDNAKESKIGNYMAKFDSYEEAELACLRKLIEIVNQNKDE